MANFQSTQNVVASSARTTAGQSDVQYVEEASTLAVHVDVTAASGTSPSLAFSVEWSNDGTTWFAADPADTFTAITTAPTRAAKAFTVKGETWRLVWAITGTSPSFTFAAHAYYH